MNPRNQSFVVTLLLIIAAVAMVVMAVQRESGSKQSLTINEVARDIKAGKVARVVIEDNNTLRIIYTDGDTDGVESYKETDSTLVAQLLGFRPSRHAPLGTAATLYAAPEAPEDETDDEYDDAESV